MDGMTISPLLRGPLSARTPPGRAALGAPPKLGPLNTERFLLANTGRAGDPGPKAEKVDLLSANVGSVPSDEGGGRRETRMPDGSDPEVGVEGSTLTDEWGDLAIREPEAEERPEGDAIDALDALEVFEWVGCCGVLYVLRTELTELEVDLRPRRPAEGLRIDECGVKVAGLKLDLLRCPLVLLSKELEVLTLGRAGSVARVCNSGRVPMLALRCCCMTTGPVEVLVKARKVSGSMLSGPGEPCWTALAPFLEAPSPGDLPRLYVPSLNQCLTHAIGSRNGC